MPESDDEGVQVSQKKSLDIDDGEDSNVVPNKGKLESDDGEDSDVVPEPKKLESDDESKQPFCKKGCSQSGCQKKSHVFLTQGKKNPKIKAVIKYRHEI